MKILVTGACGYIGSVLVPKLLAAGHEVVAFDLMWFGSMLASHPDLTVVKGDVRDTNSVDMIGVDVILHLASVANDPCGDLDPKLTWEISALATMRLADKAVRKGIKHFIYASSGSVYGVKDEEQVTEDLDLDPISEYNKTKMVAERVVLSYADKMAVQIVRSATVCGWSPRMRLDVSVNMLTMQALSDGVVTVFGGDQTRPNIHIDDITDLYIFLIDHPQVVGVYNAGFENLSIMQIARLVAYELSARITVSPSNDPRSYRINSDKLLATGFRPKKTVGDAITEIIAKYQLGILKNHDRFHNLKWMKRTVVLKKPKELAISPAAEFADYASRLSSVIEATDTSGIELLAHELLDCWKTGRQVFICGNGGSAANALHIANDYLYCISKTAGSGLRVNALAANTAVVTCLANDEGYDKIFSLQLAVQAKPDDVLIVLSGSGNSPNILNALEFAKQARIRSFALLGYSGGNAKTLVDVGIHFAIDDMQVSEDLQMMVMHSLMQWLERTAGPVRRE